MSIVNANESEPIKNQKYFQFGKNSVPVECHKIPKQLSNSVRGINHILRSIGSLDILVLGDTSRTHPEKGVQLRRWAVANHMLAKEAFEERRKEASLQNLCLQPEKGCEKVKSHFIPGRQPWAARRPPSP